MKKLILTLTLILCGYAISQASILTKQSVELEVGSNPVSILENPSDGIVHIFCAGIDANDNNTFDEGEDEKPSWWTYSPAGSSIEPMMVKEFDNFFVSPFKPSVDTIKGYTTVILPFAASKTDGEFTSNGFVQGFQMKNTVPAFKEEVKNGEYLYYERQIANTISVIRVNGNDTLKIENISTNEVATEVIEGDITDFLRLEFTNGVYLYTLKNKSILEVNIIDENGFNFWTQFDYSTHPEFTSGVKNLTAYAGNVYSVIENTPYFTELDFDPNGINHTLEVATRADLGLQSPAYYYQLSLDDRIITSEGSDVIVEDNNFIHEMHRTSSPTSIVYVSDRTVYISTENKILTYYYDNDPKRDPSIVSHSFVGYQPLDILEFDDKFLAINLGIDFNFDGEIEEEKGDQITTSNGFTLGEGGNIEKGGFLDMGIGLPINFPLNTNLNSEGEVLLPSGNYLYRVNFEDGRISPGLTSDFYISCAYSVLDYIVAGERDYANNKSFIRIKKGDFIDVKTEVGANVIDCIVYQNASGFGVVSLSEGNFGEPDSKINIIKLSTMGIGENTPIDAGTGGNSLVANADQTKAAIVMNGSHEVHILNLLTGEIDLTFSTGTTGFGGPRDAEFSGDRLYVTTYSNQIMMFDANNGEKLSSILIDGNSEGLAISGNYLLVTNNQYSNYQPSNRIYAYDIDKISNIEEAIPSEQTIRVYPHPVSNDFHIVSDDLAGNNDIAIINSQGKIVATHSGSSNGAIALNADALGLVAGNYTAIINGTRAVRFVVIK